MIQYTKEMMRLVIDNPWVAGLISVLGILISIWGVYRALRGRKLSYRRIDIPFFETSIRNNELSKVFENREIKKASVEIAIWNSGRKYINCSDMARKEPLRIVAENNSLIEEGQLLYSSSDYGDITCKVSENKKAVVIDFDYLECEEGCIVNILYNGNKDDIKVLGVIKGKKQIKKSQSIVEALKKYRVIYNILTSKVFSWFVIFLSFFMCPVAYLQSANFGAIENNFFNIPDTFGGRLVDAFVIVMLIAFSVCTSIPFWMRLTMPRFPKDLEAHFGK